MKIYANSRSSSLDKYVGQNLWVKVDIWNEFTKMYAHYYAKFNNIIGHSYSVSLIPEYEIDSGVLYDLAEVINVQWVDFDKIKLAAPVEVLTQDELTAMEE